MPQRISQFNRTEKFTPEDYDILQRILDYFQEIVTTPNILTEVNSLVNQLGKPERSQCLLIFSQIIPNLNEHYVESKTIGKCCRCIDILTLVKIIVVLI